MPEEEEAPVKTSKLPLLLGVLLAVLGGAAGYFAVTMGFIPFGKDAGDSAKTRSEISTMPDVAFVPVDPLIISLGKNPNRGYLRFKAQLEVTPLYQDEIKSLLPRVVDVLNSYLRAVEPSELERPSALIRLRAQMLRRVQMVTGEGRVRDLLIMEFVLN